MTEKINYREIITKYPWLLAKDQNCVISPDADGMICGLFMSHYLNWNIAGYYDNGKNLLLRNGLSAKDCVFLDTEIWRKEIRSCGHHIVRFRNLDAPENWDNFSNCFNPNNLRGRALRDQFGLKYPMGTIHLLLGLVGQRHEIQFSPKALFVVLQADGTINRFIDRYSENLLDWLGYMGFLGSESSFGKILHHEIDLVNFSQQYVEYVQNFVKEQKDKIPISDANGLQPESFNSSLSGFSESCQNQIVNYLTFLAERTGWSLNKDKWLWNDFKIFKFTKKVTKPGVGTYKKAVGDNFLSLAFTASDRMEYTVENPDKLP